MDVDDLSVQTVRDGAFCTLILGGALDLLAAGEFLQHAAWSLMTGSSGLSWTWPG